jgi:hypothetical protein
MSRLSSARRTLNSVKLPVLASIVVVVALGTLAALAVGLGYRDGVDAEAAQATAREWTRAEKTDPARRRGDGWEVDVHRADGSVVEVNLGPDLELIELDEELGPGGTPADDEVLGDERVQAIAAVRRHGADGFVRSVEREREGTIEVDVVRPDRTILELELDAGLRVIGTDREELGDE